MYYHLFYLIGNVAVHVLCFVGTYSSMCNSVQQPGVSFESIGWSTYCVARSTALYVTRMQAVLVTTTRNVESWKGVFPALCGLASMHRTCSVYLPRPYV